jgi:hypothetical protein
MILIPRPESYPKLPSMPITIQFVVLSLVGKWMTSTDDSASSSHSRLMMADRFPMYCSCHWDSSRSGAWSLWSLGGNCLPTRGWFAACPKSWKSSSWKLKGNSHGESHESKKGLGICLEIVSEICAEVKVCCAKVSHLLAQGSLWRVLPVAFPVVLREIHRKFRYKRCLLDFF